VTRCDRVRDLSPPRALIWFEVSLPTTSHAMEGAPTFDGQPIAGGRKTPQPIGFSYLCNSVRPSGMPRTSSKGLQSASQKTHCRVEPACFTYQRAPYLVGKARRSPSLADSSGGFNRFWDGCLRLRVRRRLETKFWGTSEGSGK
jgi:hypothetical protein